MNDDTIDSRILRLEAELDAAQAAQAARDDGGVFVELDGIWWVHTPYGDGDEVWGRGPTRQAAVDDLCKEVLDTRSFESGDPIADWSRANTAPVDECGMPLSRCQNCGVYDEVVRPGKTQPGCLCEAYRVECDQHARTREDLAQDQEELERLLAWADNGLDEDKWPPGKTISESVLARVDALTAEVARLRPFEPTLKRLAIEAGRVDFELECQEVMAVLADLFLGFLAEHKAANYTETRAEARPHDPELVLHLGHEAVPLVITVQKEHGKTPVAHRDEAIAERDAARAQLAEAKATYEQHVNLFATRNVIYRKALEWIVAHDGTSVDDEPSAYHQLKYRAEAALDEPMAAPATKSEHYLRVEEFHHRSGLPAPGVPTMPDASARRRRARLVAEEALELVEALGFRLVVNGPQHGTVVAVTGQETDTERGQGRWNLALLSEQPTAADMPHIAKECGDVSVVTIGTLIELGLPDAPILSAVDRNNLGKLGPGHSFRDDGKLLKPPGYQPPDMDAVLRAQGWTQSPE